jgi:hypothetical protein
MEKVSNKFISQSTNTGNNHILHRPNANPSCFQESTVCAGIRIFNTLSLDLTSLLKNEKAQFKLALRQYLNTLFILKMNFYVQR